MQIQTQSVVGRRRPAESTVTDTEQETRIPNAVARGGSYALHPEGDWKFYPAAVDRGAACGKTIVFNNFVVDLNRTPRGTLRGTS